MEALIVVIIAIVVIALATAVAPKLGIAGPLILVLVGGAVSLLPFLEIPEINPEFILVGVLPPLLYSAAVSLPAIEFRRDFGPIAGLSFLLVILSSVLLGFFFMAVIPGIHPAVAVALGAILSPTDAVATSIVKRLGVSRRVVTMLEGESLLNDATALVLLRTMIASVGLATSVTGDTRIGFGFIPAFAWGVVVAVVVGAIVGWLNLRLRSLIKNSAANTAIGFVVPFIAYIPTEELGGSGLVAAVVAGIVTGQGAARWFTPEQRRSDEHNWHTIELVLEGAVFLIMGLELSDIVEQNVEQHNGIGTGLGIALGALTIIIAARAGYVSLLVWLQSRRARGRQRTRLEAMNTRLDQIADGSVVPDPRYRGRRGEASFDDPRAQRRLSSMRSRVSRALSDLDYYQASPLGWKHGAIIVWAGMRGVVTLAAAQTISSDVTDDRALLVFIAFAVAVGSLMLQGFTLPWVVKALRLERPGDDSLDRAEQSALDDELRDAAVGALSSPALRRRDGSAFDEELVERIGSRMVDPPDDADGLPTRDLLELRLAMIEAMRVRLNELSSGGDYSTPALRHALAELDADQLSLELRLDDEED
ncbi:MULTISPECIES: cation:proton antiporter [Microbacterium]|uniref:Sodium, potassium, lithium and rubidium/H(+) antiporter n=1 Tax=Microbacterium trichothecenolyticum TaxID=69370 RepID=A0A0M2HHP6_MICTR|nr:MULTISPECIES: sodium:proton antiporter [Microbacterium]KJL43840.1 Sodium, potassium, lithium and rubidium/H(+) antiporter [Microbacterium trichothecenolyticum]MDR7191174.1 CPA1 family monovalent cation:H+ antiporter [Microbacterium sp. BE35]